MYLLVYKFGGSSVADAAGLRRAAGQLAAAAAKGYRLIAVVSAQGKTTDRLLQTAAALTPHPSCRETDQLLATGEQASAALLAMTLQETGLPAISLTGWQAGIHTDGNHAAAEITAIHRRRILRELEAGRIVVTAGFQGVTRRGDITTLGRGGSDTTAVCWPPPLMPVAAASAPTWMGCMTTIPVLPPKVAAMTASAMLKCWKWRSRVPGCCIPAASVWRKNTGCRLPSCAPAPRPPARWSAARNAATTPSPPIPFFCSGNSSAHFAQGGRQGRRPPRLRRGRRASPAETVLRTVWPAALTAPRTLLPTPYPCLPAHPLQTARPSAAPCKPAVRPAGQTACGGFRRPAAAVARLRRAALRACPHAPPLPGRE